MPILDAKFCEETSGDGAANIFPYLAERLNALKEIRAMEDELGARSRFTRSVLKSRGGRLIASIPFHIALHWKKTYGCWPTDDMKLFNAWLNGPGKAWKR